MKPALQAQADIQALIVSICFECEKYTHGLPSSIFI
jgi:hypothetical protein